VKVRDLHCVGAQGQQHRCVHVNVRDLQLVHGCLHHRHGICAVRCENLAYETNIVLAIKRHDCPVWREDLAAEERIFVIAVICIFNVCHHCNEHATIDADDESAVFAKDDIEEDDDWKTGPQFF